MVTKKESAKDVINRVLALPVLPKDSDMLPSNAFVFVNKPSFFDVPFSEPWLAARDDIMLLLATETINDLESSRNIATVIMRRLSILHNMSEGI